MLNTLKRWLVKAKRFKASMKAGMGPAFFITSVNSNGFLKNPDFIEAVTAAALPYLKV